MGRKRKPWTKQEYNIWKGMIKRCTDPANWAYAYYGGRGICVCERWMNGMLNWFEDVGPRPSPKHSLDRIDNNGNYEPGNVRWTTILNQARNRRGNRRIEFDGKSMIISEWAEYLGINEDTLKWRLRKWDLERALTPYLQRVWTPGWKRYRGIE